MHTDPRTQLTNWCAYSQVVNLQCGLGIKGFSVASAVLLSTFWTTAAPAEAFASCKGLLASTAGTTQSLESAVNQHQGSAATVSLLQESANAYQVLTYSLATKALKQVQPCGSPVHLFL